MYRLLRYFVVAVAALLLFQACSSSGGKSPMFKRSIKISPKEQIYFSLVPFDSLLSRSLNEKGILPKDLQESIQKEVRYQLYLKKQKISKDEKKADVQLSLHINEILSQDSSSGNQIKAKLSAYRKGYREELDIEFLSKPADENAPENFLALNLPRFITAEVLKKLQLSNTRKSKKSGSAVPQVMIVF